MHFDPAQRRGNSAPTPEANIPESVLLRAFRWWLTGTCQNDGSAQERARRELGQLIGTASAQLVLGHFDVMVRAVARHAVRSLHYHPPCCRFATPDELLLLAIVAACQGGEVAAAGALAEVVTNRAGLGATLDAASDLALSLLSAGIILDLGTAGAVSGLAALGAVTLH